MPRIRPYLIPFALGVVIVAACSRPPGQWEFDRGMKELRKGRCVQAQALLEQSIARRPGHAANAAAYNLLGVACWKLGKAGEARAAFEDSLRIDPRHADATYNLGVLLADLGDHDGAIRLLADAAALEPTSSRALEYRGQVHIRLGQWPEARRTLYAALARNPQSAAIQTALAQVEWGVGNADGALAALMNALSSNARYAPAIFSLGVVHQHLGHAREAKAYFEKFLSVAPAGDAHLAAANAALGALRTLDAVPVAPPPAAATTRPPAAAAAAPSAPATVPSNATPAAAQAAGPSDILRQAAALADKGKIALAMELCMQVAEQAGANANPALQEKALRTAAKSCFDQPRAHEALGRFLLAQQKPAEALKAFKQALVLKSDYIPAQLGMADAAIATGEFDAALVGLKDALRADPKNAEALWALAQLYDKQLDLPENAAKTYADFSTRFASDARAAQARKRAKELSPSVQFPPYPAAVAAATPLVVTAAAPVAVTAPAAPPSATPAAAPAAEPPPAQRKISYRKPAAPNTRDAVQALNRGRLFQEQENWDQAVFYYVRSIENDDTIATAFYHLASAYRAKGELELAKDGYLRALQLDPQFTNARYNLALVYQQQKDNTTAIRLLQDVVKAKPDYAAAHYVLGYLFAQSPATKDDARRAYGTFLQLAPSDPAAPAVRSWLQQTR